MKTEYCKDKIISAIENNPPSITETDWRTHTWETKCDELSITVSVDNGSRNQLNHVTISKGWFKNVRLYDNDFTQNEQYRILTVFENYIKMVERQVQETERKESNKRMNKLKQFVGEEK